jgi:hypothetical protein
MKGQERADKTDPSRKRKTLTVAYASGSDNNKVDFLIAIGVDALQHDCA